MLWYRFSFINFSSLMLDVLWVFFASLFFSFTRLYLPKISERHTLELMERSFFSFFFLLTVYNHFMNEFCALDVRACTFSQCMNRHMWNWREYMIISHAPLLWWGCSFCLNETHKNNGHFYSVSSFHEWSLDAFRCNTIGFFDKWTPQERNRKKNERQH